MKQICITILAVMIPLLMWAQDQPQLQRYQVSKAATVIAKDIKNDFKPALHNLEKPVPGSDSYRNYLLYLKEQMKYGQETSPKTGNNSTANEDAERPLLHRNFEGNEFNIGVPNDNDVAISNDGMLISVINSNIYMFDVNEDSLLMDISLEAFADTLGLPQDNYDPKVLYDPKQDRFIIIYLDGRTDSTSYIVVGFSQTNNPTLGWNLYALDGSPLNDSTWSDYPMVAITDEELFITANLIRTGVSWQLGFTESIIWQVDKAQGYAGATSLNSAVHSNIKHNSQPIRNLCPVQSGSGSTGPNIYLLSNKNFDITNDTVFFLEVTGNLSDPNLSVDVSTIKANPAYGLAPDGKQLGTQVLQTNDSRVLSGFIQNGIIQYVQNSINTGNGRASVYHGLIENVTSNPSISGYIISNDSLDFGYPNISYSGKYDSDNEAIITFLHTGENTQPAYSSVFYDGNSNHSTRLILKEGEAWVNVLSGSFERWGDYTGSQRKYNEPGAVWAAGSFGKLFRIGLNNFYATGTWIAELASPDTTSQPPAGIVREGQKKLRSTAYPNPSADRVIVEFELPETTILDITLYNLKGQLIKTLYRDKAKKGQNQFSFSVEPLSPGIYLLAVTDKGKTIITERIVKE